MTTESEFLNAYERIKTAHKSILKAVDQALRNEEQGNTQEAMKAYEKILHDIEDVFIIPVGLPDDDSVDDEWLDACAMIQKLKNAKQELLYRLRVLRAQHSDVDHDASDAMELNISDEENDSPNKLRRSILNENPKTHLGFSNAGDAKENYIKTIQSLRELIATRNANVLYDTLFHAQVKLYKIEGNGAVCVVAGETSMSLVMCTVGAPWQHLNGVCFIQCAMPSKSTANAASSTEKDQSPHSENPQENNMIWIYALLPAITTCYRTDYGAFIFPDMESNDGTAFGIMLTPRGLANESDEEAFADLQQFLLDLLEAMLAGTVEHLEYAGTSERRERDLSTKVSRNVVNVADFIARNLVKGAEKTGDLMDRSTPYIISKLQSAPENPKPVSSTVQTTVCVAKTVSTAAVGVTGWIACKVGAAATAVGGYLAPHVQTQGAKLLERGFGYEKDEANKKMEGALTIAAGAVEGASKVYGGVEDAAVILGNRLSDNSVKIIEHKYGSSASSVASDTFDTIGNAFRVSENVNYIKPKGLVKKLAKNTGKAVVIDYRKTYAKSTEVVAAGRLYPDLRNVQHD